MDNSPLEFQVKRDITDLYKQFLVLLSDLYLDHLLSMSNLRKALKSMEDRIEGSHGVRVYLEPIAMQANYWNEDRQKLLRKKILDLSNDKIREFEEQLKLYLIEFKKEQDESTI